MDRRLVERHPATARADVALGEQHLARQILGTFESTQVMHSTDASGLEDELAALDREWGDRA